MSEFYELITQQTNDSVKKSYESIQEQLESLQKQTKEFIQYVCDGGLEVKENEEGKEENEEQELEQKILQHEAIFDRMEEIMKMKQEMIKTKKDIIKHIDDIFLNCQLNDESIDEYHDEIIVSLTNLEDKLHEMKKKQRLEKKTIKINPDISRTEKRKLEEWTGMKCGKTIFDSDKNKWSRSYSVFGDIVNGRSNLLFVVEDTNRNKFGGFVKSTIQNIYNQNYNQNDSQIYDKNAFLFKLQSGGERQMMKFDSVDGKNAFTLYSQSSNSLFGFGPSSYALHVSKTDNKINSHCYNQQGFKFSNQQKLIGGSKMNEYTPLIKR